MSSPNCRPIILRCVLGTCMRWSCEQAAATALTILIHRLCCAVAVLHDSAAEAAETASAADCRHPTAVTLVQWSTQHPADCTTPSLGSTNSHCSSPRGTSYSSWHGNRIQSGSWDPEPHHCTEGKSGSQSRGGSLHSAIQSHSNMYFFASLYHYELLRTTHLCYCTGQRSHTVYDKWVWSHNQAYFKCTAGN